MHGESLLRLIAAWGEARERMGCYCDPGSEGRAKARAEAERLWEEIEDRVTDSGDRFEGGE